MHNKELIYPVFLKCCQYTTDVFWQNIFENMAYGNPPYGTYFSKRHLCSSYKSREFSYKIDETENIDSKKLYEDIYSLLTKKLGLASQKEKAEMQKIFNTLENNIREENKAWNNIRKKNNKDMLVEKYVIAQQKLHKLSIKQSRYFLSLLIMLIGFKIITPKDIVYNNGCIDHIHGLEIQDGNIIVNKNIYGYDLPTVLDQQISVKQTASLIWEKYVKQLQSLNEKIASN